MSAPTSIRVRANSFLARFADERPRIYAALLVAIVCAFAIPLCRRGIIMSDEGYMLKQAVDMLGGRVIYRDMDAFVTPGMWFVIAGFFALFEPSVIVSRIPIFLGYVATAIVTYRLVKPLTNRTTATLAGLAFLLFSVWAFPAWTFAFYSPMAVLFALAALERLLAWHRAPTPWGLLPVGLLLGLAILFKQNYGIFALIGCFASYWALRLGAHRQRPVRLLAASAEIGTTAAGVAAIGLPCLVYFFANGAVGDAWYSLVVHPFQFMGQHDIAFPAPVRMFESDLLGDGVDRLTYGAFALFRTEPISWMQPVRLVERMHILAYWIPVAIFVLGLGMAIRPSLVRRPFDAPLFAVVVTCALVFWGVMPRADFNHLVNVYQAAIVAGAVVLHRAWQRLPTPLPMWAWAPVGAVGIVASAYAYVALHWYAGLVESLQAPVPGPRGGVLVGVLEAEVIGFQLRTIERLTEPGDALLTVPDLAMLNFLADREMPSKYYNLYQHHIAADGGQAVVDGAEARGVEVAVTRFDNFFSDRVGLVDYAPPLTRYLRSQFDVATVGSNDDFLILEKREEPRTELRLGDALDDCDYEPSDTNAVDLRHHLLFSSLYHRSRPSSPMPPEGRETRCRVHVPEEGAWLRFDLGYRHPARVAPGSTITGTIVVDHDGESETLYEGRYRIMARRRALTQFPYHEERVDLSPFAGETIELRFHSRLSGAVAAHPLDFKGFALVWRDPHLVARSAQEGPRGPGDVHSADDTNGRVDEDAQPEG